MTPYFTLSNIPMPPSHNDQYAARAFKNKHSQAANAIFAKSGKSAPSGFTMARICPTRELETYQGKTFKAWAETNAVALAKARQFMRDEILMKGEMLSIHRFVCWPSDKLWTLKGQPKKLDATNRIKALDDCLAAALGVDDTCFWGGQVIKFETTKDPYVIVCIKPWKPLGVRDISAEFLARL